MASRLTFLILFIVAAACGSVPAQSSSASMLPDASGQERDMRAKTVRDQMEKLRIAREKKEYQELLERGNQALALSEQLERNLQASPSISSADIERLESLEKLVKKIRSELGGSDDDPDDAEITNADGVEAPAKLGTLAEAFSALKKQTFRLVSELKKTTRFSISAAAIRSSNAVLRLTRLLRPNR